MAMGRWRVDGSLGHLWLVQSSRWRGELNEPGWGAALGAEAAAHQVDVWFPDGWGDDPGASTLANIAAALGEEILWSHDGAARRRLKGLVRQALRDGRLIAVRVGMPAAPGGAEVEDAAGNEANTAPIERAPRDDTTWIEIVLVDEADPPQPVPFRKYRIELPDGEVREGQLDAQGKAMIRGIDPGTCQVAFADLDESVWQRA